MLIQSFRKEMKKWHLILWVVLASMLLSSFASVLLYKSYSGSDMAIASVNRRKIYAKDLQRAYTQVSAQLEQLKGYAAAYNIEPKTFIATMLGGMEPAEFALWSVVRETVANQVVDELGIKRSDAWFSEQLLKSLPPQLVNRDGGIDIEAYQRFTTQLGLTPRQYEELRRAEFGRQTLETFLRPAAYLPESFVNAAVSDQSAKKQFTILTLDHEAFLPSDAQKKEIETRVEEFYARHSDAYRTKELRAAKYCVITPSTHVPGLATAEVDDQAINTFYERNKSKLFRVPVQVKVRHILLKKGKNKEENKKTTQRILEWAEQCKAKPELFASLAKQFSQDTKSAAKGGLLDVFSRGSSQYDATFERAALGLKEPGAVSGLVKTEQGFHIIQLVDRSKAEEKPLDEVRGEIIQTLSARKRNNQVKSMVEQFVRGIGDQKETLEEFASRLGLAIKTVDPVAQDDLEADKDKDAKRMQLEVVRKLFAGKKKEGQLGYFQHEDALCIYQVSNVTPSKIPALKDVREKILNRMYKEHAYQEAQNFSQEAKAKLLNGQTTLAGLAKEKGVSLVETSLMLSNGTNNDLSKVNLTPARVWGLNDPKQVLIVPQKNRHCLVQLVTKEPVSDSKTYKSTGKRTVQEYRRLVNAVFFASLLHHATIDVDKNFAGLQATMKENL